MKRNKVLKAAGKKNLCLLLFLLAISVFQFSCNSNSSSLNQKENDSLAIRQEYAESPVLSPEESMKTMVIEKGFSIKLIAAEPLVNSPVAMLFDEKGRMWVVEMEGYMPNVEGKGEDKPAGKIVILEDENHDGVADTRKIFMDSLVLPRAISFIEDGLLIAEPPNLWYVKIQNDRPSKKILVDDKYTEGGNVEHQPNALYRAMDNWIYNAEAKKRYKKKGNAWVIDRMIQRGQWGISQDDNGRLFYNNNSQNLLGDYFPPVFGAANSNQRRVSGYNENIAGDNKVYPLRATPGVNRGYMKGVLDDSLRLVNFTAASGPVIYRGDLFPSDYYQNAFVPEPSANLIKRDILKENGNKVSAKVAYTGKEFLSSTDERFRPVTAYNGPDGALYVIDMYRGVIQHKTYVTDYLKSEIKSRDLEEPINRGRLYKIVPDGKQAKPVTFSRDPQSLVQLLTHPNGWVRDKAQQMLVDGKYETAVPALDSLLKSPQKPYVVAHALWTLEGMNKLKPEHVTPFLKDQDWKIRMQALGILPSVINKSNYKQFLPYLQDILHAKDSLAAPYVAFLAKSVQPFDAAESNKLLLQALAQFPRDIFVADAVISNLENREQAFLKQVNGINPDTTVAIYKRMQRLFADMRNSSNSKKTKALEKDYPKGAALFKSVCQTCHGGDGNGIKSLAPPLNTSNWVTGDKNKLIPIVLFGLTGPVKVGDNVYGPPEISGDMPGIGNNKEFTDEDLAQVISFIRRAWNNDASAIQVADIKNTRDKFKGRQKAFTAEELKKIK